MTRARGVAAIVVCAALAVALVGQLTGSLDLRPGAGAGQQPTTSTRPSDVSTTEAASSVPTGASSVPTVDEDSARMAAAHDLLSARAAAVKAKNRTAWMATVDVSGSAFGRRQSLAFGNLIKLPLDEFTYGTVRASPALGAARVARVGPKAWVASVSGTYSLAGYDRAPVFFGSTFTFVQRQGGWRIADDTDGATAVQMWDLPGLRVLRGRSGIVIGNAPESRMRDYSVTADSAVRRVNGVWGTNWSSRVVIVTPATSKEFAKLLLRSADEGLDQVAAITQGVIDPGQPAKGDRVVINPNAFTALQPSGRRVVITHELTHVAVRSSTSRPVPIWLSEGTADYVGYSGLGLPRARVAAELLTLVRQGKGPKVLPTAADFDPSRTKIAPFYSASWLAVSRLVDLYGQAKVVAFYRAIAGRQSVSPAIEGDPEATAVQAFPKSFGVTQAQFVAGWKRYLLTLAQPRG